MQCTDDTEKMSTKTNQNKTKQNIKILLLHFYIFAFISIYNVTPMPIFPPSPYFLPRVLRFVRLPASLFLRVRIPACLYFRVRRRRPPS